MSIAAPPDTLGAALAWHDAGACVVPARHDGTKAPEGLWKAFQAKRPDRGQVEAWFSGGRPGLGVICGAISGNLEMLEFEGRAVDEGTEESFIALVKGVGLGDLWERLTDSGYVETTPSGGIHILYRVDGETVPGNLKLARRPATAEELAAKPGEKTKVLIETRGEGGFVITAPSHGTVHATGLAWTAIGVSSPATIPTITAAERTAIIELAKSFDQIPAVPQTPPQPRPTWNSHDGISPGDDYEAKTDWSEILVPAGWTLVGHSAGTRYWKRPGKTDPGFSATTGRAADRDRLYVFSTATEFPDLQPLTKFHVYALLHHNGDHSAAAKDLRGRGYGAQRQAKPEFTAPAQPVDHAEVTSEAPPPVEYFGATQDGLAQALVAHYGHKLRYCPQRGRWLYWTGHRWLWDEAEQHRELVRRLARTLPKEDGWKRFRAGALSSQGVSGIVRLAQSDSKITVPLMALDARPYELNTPDGIIDLRTGTVGKPDPAALHTRCTTVAPDFGRRSDVFEKFLADTFTDIELTHYIQRLLGVSMIGSVLEQILPFAHGEGANGKSTLLEAVMYILGLGEGGYAMAAPSEMLMIRKHSEHPAEMAQLAGARIVVCSELDDGQRFAEAKVKLLTGRDSINARFMRRDPFTFTPSHTLWLLGNHKPATRTGGPAFWRRVRLLPFNNVVPEKTRDPRLGEKLNEDAAAILAWIVQGAAAYQGGGLRDPAIVREATQEYENDQNTVARFVEDECHLMPGRPEIRAWRDELRTAYERWCADIGDEPVTPRAFMQQIRKMAKDEGKEKKSGGRRYIPGIGLRQSNDADEEVPQDEKEVPQDDEDLFGEKPW